MSHRKSRSPINPDRVVYRIFCSSKLRILLTTGVSILLLYLMMHLFISYGDLRKPVPECVPCASPKTVDLLFFGRRLACPRSTSDVCSVDELGQSTTDRLLLRLYARTNQPVPTSILQYRNISANLSARYIIPTFITSNVGLGNWLFLVASAYGLSRLNGEPWRPAILSQPEPRGLGAYLWDHDEHPRRILYFPHLGVEEKSMTEAFNLSEGSDAKNFTLSVGPWAKYNPVVKNISRSPLRNVGLDDYLQVFGYFHTYREDIHYMLQFNDEINLAAIEAIEKMVQEYFRSPYAPTVFPNLVGIHVRRGDILNKGSMAHGHGPASTEYLLRATSYMEKQHAPVLFVVVSNDYGYCKEILKGPGFVFADPHPEQVDMAILRMVDYLVLTVGSFGWWSAYLGDAREVLYYKNWPKNGSVMANGFSREDYFPSWWVPFE